MTVLENIMVLGAIGAAGFYLLRRYQYRRPEGNLCSSSNCGCSVKLKGLKPGRAQRRSANGWDNNACSRNLLTVLVACFALDTSYSSAVEDETSSGGWWKGDYATGTWGGFRDQLSQRGFTVNLEYTGDGWGNVSGGLKTGAAWLQLAQFGMDWDPEPLIPGWRGALFRVSGWHAWQTRSLTLDLVGDVNGVDNIEAPIGARLYEFWWQQSLWDERFTFQIGNLLADENFAYTDYGGLFINSGFGWSQFIAANTGTIVPAYPFAAPGVRLEVQPTRPTYFQIGVYDGDALDNALGELDDNPYGTRFRLHGNQGVFGMAEVGYRLNQTDDDTGLPGTYKMGGSFHSADHADLYRDDDGNSFILSGLEPHQHSYGYMLYFAGEQMVWRESPTNNDQGLGAFFRLGAGPADRSTFDLVIDCGLHYQGLLPSRDEDAFGLGFIYVGVSKDLRRQELDDRDLNGTPLPAISDYEMVIELTYQAKINNWWYLQPDVQWIIHPGGSGATPDAWVLGLRTGFVF